MLPSFNMSLVNLIKNNVFGTSADTRYCPVCSHLGDFDPSGSKKNSICPKCGSNERARLYFLYMMSVGFGKNSCKALHILPERCIRYKINNDSNINYTPAGLSDFPEVLNKKNKYDYIFANYVMDRVEDDVGLIDNIKECLTKGGIAMVSVHIYDQDDLSAVPRKYSAKYSDLLKSPGFEVEIKKAADICGVPMLILCGIPENEVVVTIKRV